MAANALVTPGVDCGAQDPIFNVQVFTCVIQCREMMESSKVFNVSSNRLSMKQVKIIPDGYITDNGIKSSQINKTFPEILIKCSPQCLIAPHGQKICLKRMIYIDKYALKYMIPEDMDSVIYSLFYVETVMTLSHGSENQLLQSYYLTRFFNPV